MKRFNLLKYKVISRALPSLVLLGLILSSSVVQASGFVVARFGGEHGHPTSDNLSAMYYNPAALTLGKGFRLMIDGTFAHRSVDFTRAEEAISSPGVGTPSDALYINSGQAQLRNWATAPFISLAHDFGIPKLSVALGVFAPFGGGASWSENDQVTAEQRALYPGAQDGQQRWWSIDSSLKSIYISLAAAYQLNEQLSFGFAINRVNTSIDTVRARTVPEPETDNIVNTSGRSIEGRSFLNAASSTFSIGAGVMYQPNKNIRIGYSYQSQPGFGEMRLEGDLKVTDDNKIRDPQQTVLVMSLPDIHRLGFQYGQKGQWEMRLFADYVRWRVFDRQCLLSKLDAECDLNDTQVPIVLNINKNWKDAYGVRLGGSYWLTPQTELYLGGGYDANAAPDQGVDPSLFDMDKLSGALGARLSLLEEKMRLGLTFTQVFYFARDIPVVKNEDGQATNGFTGYSRGPSAAGKYEQAVSVANLYMEYQF